MYLFGWHGKDLYGPREPHEVELLNIIWLTEELTIGEQQHSKHDVKIEADMLSILYTNVFRIFLFCRLHQTTHNNPE